MLFRSTSDKIASNSITSDKIASNAITVLNNALTTIDANGVTIKNGALKILNNAGEVALMGDSNGNLVLKNGEVNLKKDDNTLAFSVTSANNERFGVRIYSSRLEIGSNNNSWAKLDINTFTGAMRGYYNGVQYTALNMYNSFTFNCGVNAAKVNFNVNDASYISLNSANDINLNAVNVNLNSTSTINLYGYCKFSGGTNISSTKDIKCDIRLENNTYSALELIRNTDFYRYKLKSDVKDGYNDYENIGVIVEYKTPNIFKSRDKDGINLYTMCSTTMLALKNVDSRTTELEKKVFELEQEVLRLRNLLE